MNSQDIQSNQFGEILIKNTFLRRKYQRKRQTAENSRSKEHDLDIMDYKNYTKIIQSKIDQINLSKLKNTQTKEKIRNKYKKEIEIIIKPLKQELKKINNKRRNLLNLDELKISDLSYSKESIEPRKKFQKQSSQELIEKSQQNQAGISFIKTQESQQWKKTQEDIGIQKSFQKIKSLKLINEHRVQINSTIRQSLNDQKCGDKSQTENISVDTFPINSLIKESLIRKLLKGDNQISFVVFQNINDKRGTCSLKYFPKRFAIFSKQFNPLFSNPKELQKKYQSLLGIPTYFELSLHEMNDKILAEEMIQQRKQYFFDQGVSYPIIITSRSTSFFTKAQLFPNTVMIIGINQLISILDINAYKNNTFKEMIKALNIIKKLGISFMVLFEKSRKLGNLRTYQDVIKIMIPSQEQRQQIPDIFQNNLQGKMENFQPKSPSYIIQSDVDSNLIRFLKGDQNIQFLLFKDQNDKRGTCLKEFPEKRFAIIPISFDQIHDAHINLAKKVKKIKKIPIYFEISILIKQYFSDDIINQRILVFRSQLKLLFSEQLNIHVLITRQLSYLGKAQLFPNTVMIISIDQFFDILNLKNYKNWKFKSLSNVLQQIKQLNCQFLIDGLKQANINNILEKSFPNDSIGIPSIFKDMTKALEQDYDREEKEDNSVLKIDQSSELQLLIPQESNQGNNQEYYEPITERLSKIEDSLQQITRLITSTSENRKEKANEIFEDVKKFNKLILEPKITQVKNIISKSFQSSGYKNNKNQIQSEYNLNQPLDLKQKVVSHEKFKSTISKIAGKEKQKFQMQESLAQKFKIHWDQNVNNEDKDRNNLTSLKTNIQERIKQNKRKRPISMYKKYQSFRQERSKKYHPLSNKRKRLIQKKKSKGNNNEDNPYLFGNNQKKATYFSKVIQQKIKAKNEKQQYLQIPVIQERRFDQKLKNKIEKQLTKTQVCIKPESPMTNKLLRHTKSRNKSKKRRRLTKSFNHKNNKLPLQNNQRYYNSYLNDSVQSLVEQQLNTENNKDGVKIEKIVLKPKRK